MDDQSVYEVGYLLMPSLSEERALELVANLQAKITSLGGSLIQEGAPERMDLAYTMIKVVDNKNIRVNDAHYGWLKFYLAPASIADIKVYLDGNIDIIRTLVFKTVPENTFIARKQPKKRRAEGEADSASEDLDAIIDAAPTDTESVEAPVVTEEAPTESELLDNKIESLIPDSE
jgi:ribosomal protein S6